MADEDDNNSDTVERQQMIRNVRARPELGLSAASAFPEPSFSHRRMTGNEAMVPNADCRVLNISGCVADIPAYNLSLLSKKVSNRKRPRNVVRRRRIDAFNTQHSSQPVQVEFPLAAASTPVAVSPHQDQFLEDDDGHEEGVYRM